MLEVAAAIAAGGVIGLAVFAVIRANDDPEPITTTVSTLPVRGPLDPADLIEQFERSRTAEFALVGDLQRSRGGQVELVAVRQARRDDRALDEVGATSIVRRNDELLRCERIGGEVLCRDPEPRPTVDEEVAVFTALVDGETARYDIYNETTDPTEAFGASANGLGLELRCWTLLARNLPAGGYGDESTLCFDQETGALVLSATRNGESVDTLRTTDLRLDVVDADLEPRR